MELLMRNADKNLEEKLSVQVGDVDGVQVDDLNVFEALG